MKFDIKAETLKHSQEISRWLAKTMNIGPYDLCLCGTGKKYKFCCYENPSDKLLFSDNAFEKTIKYRDSQGGKITKFPLSLFNEFQQKALSRLSCLYPECQKAPVSCHLIPENILRKNFGTFCNQFRLTDKHITGAFVQTGAKDAGALPVFCSDHDSSLFKSIDTLKIDFTNQEQLFLLAFKAIAFSLRNTQYLLALDSQVEMTRPILIAETQDKPASFEIDIYRLHMQYIRFTTAFNIFQKAVLALSNGNWDFFSFVHRKISNTSKIFFAGFLNPSHDLNGLRINNAHTAINLTCNVFSKDGQLNALLACPGSASKKAYQNFLTQVKKTDEQTLITILDNIFAISAEKPLMPIDFGFSEDEAEKMNFLDQLSNRAIDSNSKEILDLKNSAHEIKFINCENL